MSEDRVTFEIDGKEITAPKGSMVIQAADEAGIYIPRFCYHPRLKVVANCRQCLVEVEGAPKPAPACATPVSEGMKVRTRSDRAIDAQRATMEFLLINHPLDCPICDQGGECELQDLALGYGQDVSRFTERKRVVADKNLGSLVSTDMTRCIHCTRCIRVLEEVGGRQEMGATGRGESMKIGTYVEQSIDSELSGNIIDVCPVGALNSKPFRMRARGWEMLQHETVGAHDCVGSNLYAHSLRGKFMRVVPRLNDSVNECWISDRDRFSYAGLYHPDRLRRPMVKENGEWLEVDWETGLRAAADAIDAARETGGDQSIGTLLSPNATLEEMFLLQKLVRGVGQKDIDCRLRQWDFRDDAGDPRYPAFGVKLAEIPHSDALLLIGSRIHKEVPMLGYRIRRAAQAGAKVMFLNTRYSEYQMPVYEQRRVSPGALLHELAVLVKVAGQMSGRDTNDLLKGFSDLKSTDAAKGMLDALMKADSPVLLLGHQALQHPQYADLRRLAVALAELVDAKLGYVTEGANTAGAYLTGALPHRGPGGVPVDAGASIRGMIENPRKAYLLYGVEPELDCWNRRLAMEAMSGADHVVALTSFVTPAMRRYADVMLPVGAFGETPGTFVNGEGRIQRFSAVSVPVGETRPGWKVLRALGHQLCGEDAFPYVDLAEVHESAQDAIGGTGMDTMYAGSWVPEQPPKPEHGLLATATAGLYQIDPLVRRSVPLQNTIDALKDGSLCLHPDDAKSRDISDGGLVRVFLGSEQVAELTARYDKGLIPGHVSLPSATSAVSGMGCLWNEVEVEAVAEAAQA